MIRHKAAALLLKNPKQQVGACETVRVINVTDDVNSLSPIFNLVVKLVAAAECSLSYHFSEYFTIQ